VQAIILLFGMILNYGFLFIGLRRGNSLTECVETKKAGIIRPFV